MPKAIISGYPAPGCRLHTKGALWTPGYWGWNNGNYAYNEGYWGSQVGYYGGVNYGGGFLGVGFAGASGAAGTLPTTPPWSM